MLESLLEEAASYRIVEFAAVLFSLTYLYFATIEKPICFVFGLLGSLIYIWVFGKAGLVYEASINVYYVVMSVYGYVMWNKGETNEVHRPIIRLSAMQWAWVAIGGGLLVWPLGYLAEVWLNASLSYMDAFTTVFALIATWMVVKKYLENWVVWIVVDGLSIGMFYYKELYFTTFLFLVYTVVAIFGYIKWNRAFALQPSA